MNSESCYAVFEENLVKVKLKPQHDNPTNCDVFFNQKMRVNREFVLSALTAHVNGLDDAQKPVYCLDAFSATGIAGLQWKRNLRSSVHVTLNDSNVKNRIEMLRNVDLNEMMTIDGESHPTSAGVEVTCLDANVLMHQRQFHFIHLDPFGSSSVFLDAAFRNVYNNGIVVVTATDVASLYGTCPAPALRNYGAHVIRTDYVKELAARVLIASASRSAAKCNKGIRVLYCVGVEHFVQVGFHVVRGAKHADASVSHVSELLHCTACQSWAANDHVKTAHVALADPYGLLPCKCHQQQQENSAVVLGPAWCGDIFDAEFVLRMRDAARTAELSSQTQTLLSTIHAEASLDQRNNVASCETATTQTDLDVSAVNKMQTSFRLSVTDGNCMLPRVPMFYHCLHRRHVTNLDIPKMVVILRLLHNAGFVAAPTHLDSRGAVRTNATARQLVQLLRDHSGASHKDK